ncbi:MAG: hypothetical protein ABW321_34170 [Polyangiales bacterium]
MPNEDPPRLKYSQDVPPQLVRALQALHQGEDDRARISRVSAKLQAELDAAQPLAAKGLAGLAVKVCLGALALIVPSVWWLQHEPTVDQQPASTDAGAPAVAAPEAAPTAEPVPALAVTSTPAAAGSAAISGSPRERRVKSQTYGASRGSRSSGTNRVGRGDATSRDASSAAAPASAVATQAQPRSAAVDSRAHQNGAQPSADATEAQRGAPVEPQPTAARAPEPVASRSTEPQPTDAQGQPPINPSEAKLLFEARVALRNNPTHALRTLDEHAKRYPNGRLVPEREVLTIEALRALGRTEEAETRANQFRARYPGSFHLKRLKQR